MPTPAQLRKIFAGAREAGLGEADMRDLVEQISGQRSTRELSVDQAAQLIDHLVTLGARKGFPRRKPSGRRRAANETQLITPGQVQLIEQIRAEIGGDLVRDDYFAGFARKAIGHERPRTAGEATKLVEALKRRRSWRPKAPRA